MYDFAITEFPSFMMGLPNYQRILNKRSVLPRIADGVEFILSDQVLPGQPVVFEYVSDRNYILFKVLPLSLHLKVFHIGETVIDSSYSDFLEVKTDILKYS